MIVSGGERNTYRVRLEVLARLDHRRQRYRVIQQQPAGGRLLRKGHVGGLVAVVGVCSELPSVCLSVPLNTGVPE